MLDSTSGWITTLLIDLAENVLEPASGINLNVLNAS